MSPSMSRRFRLGSGVLGGLPWDSVAEKLDAPGIGEARGVERI